MRTFAARRRLALTVLLSVLVLGSSAVQTTTVLRVTFSEAVDEAELIAIGTVSAVEPVWDAERETPFTEVTFTGVEVLKGRLDSRQLTLRFLGGPAPNGLTLRVSGMPQFAVNQEAVVFSAGNGIVACPLVGWWQGLYRIVYDAERDVRTVADHAGRPVAAIDGQVGRRVARLSAEPSAPAADALTVDQFRVLIRSEL